MANKSEWEKGFVQVYTGNGKGKTTASFGLALRAAGAGLNVFIAQFVKGMKYSELEAFKRFDDVITIKQYGLNCFIVDKPTQKDIDIAKKGLSEVKEIIKQVKI
jgi:cob(I)alamin adenosyltransferase